MDFSLGFAAGVMLAAAFWSLLTPAIDQAKVSGTYGSEGQFAFGPVIAGFLLGAVFCYACDIAMSRWGTDPTKSMLALIKPDIESNSDMRNSITISVDNEHGSLSKKERQEMVVFDRFVANPHLQDTFL